MGVAGRSRARRGRLYRAARGAWRRRRADAFFHGSPVGCPCACRHCRPACAAVASTLVLPMTANGISSTHRGPISSAGDRLAHGGRCGAGAGRRARRHWPGRPCQPPCGGAVRRAPARRSHRLHDARSRAAGRGGGARSTGEPPRRRAARARAGRAAAAGNAGAARRARSWRRRRPARHFRDLTEQDRLARMRADFVANASHELRTPLASLRGFVETLQGAAKDDPARASAFSRSWASRPSACRAWSTTCCR